MIARRRATSRPSPRAATACWPRPNGRHRPSRPPSLRRPRPRLPRSPADGYGDAGGHWRQRQRHCSDHWRCSCMPAPRATKARCLEPPTPCTRRRCSIGRSFPRPSRKPCRGCLRMERNWYSPASIRARAGNCCTSSAPRRPARASSRSPVPENRTACRRGRATAGASPSSAAPARTAVSWSWRPMAAASARRATARTRTGCRSTGRPMAARSSPAACARLPARAAPCAGSTWPAGAGGRWTTAWTATRSTRCRATPPMGAGSVSAAAPRSATCG